jgi:hypothetical protein
MELASINDQGHVCQLYPPDVIGRSGLSIVVFFLQASRGA